MNPFLIIPVVLLLGILLFLMPFIYVQFESSVNATALSDEGQEAYDVSVGFWYSFFKVIPPLALGIIAVAVVVGIAVILKLRS